MQYMFLLKKPQITLESVRNYVLSDKLAAWRIDPLWSLDRQEMNGVPDISRLYQEKTGLEVEYISNCNAPFLYLFW